MAEDAAAKRDKGGRPRDVSIDEAVLPAAWQALAQHGYDRFTIDAVAEIAGCGRATLYRRYRTKSDLISSLLRDAYHRGRERSDLEGSPRANLVALAMAGVEILNGPVGPAMLSIFATAHRVPELSKWWEEFRSIDQIDYNQQFLALSADTPNERLNLAYYSIIGSLVMNTGVRCYKLTRDDAIRIVDASISIIIDRSGSDDLI